MESKPLVRIRSLARKVLHRQNDLPPFIIKDEFLPQDDFAALRHWALSVPCRLTRQDMNWREILVGDFAEVKISEPFVTEEKIPPKLDVFARAVRDFARVGEEHDLFFQVYRWAPRSGIGLHKDGFARTLTLYLHDTWDPSWGGDLIYYESDKELELGRGHCLKPVANRLVLNNSKVPHKVGYSSSTAAERISIQGFAYPRGTYRRSSQPAVMGQGMVVDS